MNDIIPAIIPSDLETAEEQLGKVLGLVKKAQVDIVDGQYADVKTWPFVEKNSDDLLLMARREKKFPHIDDLALQFDLMILHPIEYISDLIEIGAKSFVIHIDSTDHVKECLETIRNSGREAGLGIKPSVDSSSLDTFLPAVDFVQFMGNDRIGHSGTELDGEALSKITKFHESHPHIPIQIDIGVSETTIPKLKEAGVTSFVSGSAIFGAPDIKEILNKLQNL